MTKNNVKIRESMKKHYLTQWQLADILGVHEQTITRWFRHELPEAEQIRIIKAIEDSEEVKSE